jgi:hypothetical protein
VADERSLHERLIELVVFVPVGIAASVAEELPGLAEKGRESLSKQLQVARVLGKLTVAQAQRRVRKMSANAPSKPAGATKRSGATTPGGSPTGQAPPRRSPAGNSSAAVHGAPTPAAERPAGESSRGAEVGGDQPADPPEVASLPIPGYDTLAASQVVQRLGSLRADELDAVRRYEVATRGRRTILHRIAQLSSSDGRASA